MFELFFCLMGPPGGVRVPRPHERWLQLPDGSGFHRVLPVCSAGSPAACKTRKCCLTETYCFKRQKDQNGPAAVFNWQLLQSFIQ